jgi:hypothetical protein
VAALPTVAPGLVVARRKQNRASYGQHRLTYVTFAESHSAAMQTAQLEVSTDGGAT